MMSKWGNIMTTPTPISESGTLTAANAPLDLASLARLANEMFSALPAINPVAGLVSRPAVTSLYPAEGATTATALAASPPSTPPNASSAATATALPRSGPLQSYYFLTQTSGAPAAAAAAGLVTIDSAPVDTLRAQSFGFPGELQLREVLAEPTEPAQTAPPVRSAATTGVISPGFYFLDTLEQNPAAGLRNPGFDAHPPFDVQAIRRDFPILAERVNGLPLIWFDNAATTQKPRAVIDRLTHFYSHENSNIHRAAHELAARATDAYESARNKVARFLGAGTSEEIIFVRGATEGINLVAQSWGRANVGAGDEIIISHLEHHANIVPWQQLALERGARLRVIPVDDSGQVLLEEYHKLLNDHTKLVAISQVSNALGTITPVAEIIDAAHRVGARVLVDGAQAVSHLRVNVQALGADFYVFSGHKLFAPTGIGVVFGKSELLNSMPPWQTGGNMIQDVTLERSTFQPAPARFEAGTGNIADAVGLGAAIDYVERIGLENIGRYEHGLLAYATEGMQSVPGLRLIGTANEKASVQSFILDGYRPEDVGTALNREGIAVRAGHHCAQPILRRFGVEATVRPSFAFYNTCTEIDVLVRALHRLAQHTGRSKR
jgi:cysteine desulfurase/selenocysteine lyase